MVGTGKQQWFTIGGLTFCIDSDVDIEELLFTPQPYNLHINYALEEARPITQPIKIVIRTGTEKLDISYLDEVLHITGDVSPMFHKGYNQQFGLFGNKGILNRFILHALEKNRSAVLHACAIIHPTTRKICIGIGASGSGKSVFVSNALKMGWELIATEHVIVKEGMALHKGNQFDNITPKAVEFIQKELIRASVFEDKELREPVGSKFLADLTDYGSDGQVFDLRPGYSIVLLSFGNAAFKDASPILDKDFLLRIMQQTASEKICFPMIFDDQIFPNKEIEGDADLRTTIVNTLIKGAETQLILGGDYEHIEQWLKSQY